MTIKQNEPLSAIIGSLIRFSLPLILSGMLQQLYNWADAFIVGNVEGELALGAIGATGSPVSFFVTIMTGFTLGLSVLVAHRFGEERTEDIPRILSLFSVLAGAVFLVVAAAGFFLAYDFMALLHTTADSIDMASEYLRIIFLGFPFLAVYNVYAATLRGVGDSRTPFLSILVSSLVNVALDILFVAHLRWGVAGAAAATVLSQAVMTVFLVRYSTKKHALLRFTRSAVRLRGGLAREGAGYGLPPMLQSCVTSLGSLILQDFMNGFGTQTVIAITTAYRIDTLIMLPIVNLGSGIATFTAQSCGAGDRARTRKVLRAGLVVSLVTAVLLTALVIPTGGRLIALFGAGEEAVAIGSAFFLRLASFYPVFGAATAVRGYLEGEGDLAFSSGAGIAALAVRIAGSYLLAPYFDNMVIAWAETISWVFLLLLYVLRARTRGQRDGGAA